MKKIIIEIRMMIVSLKVNYKCQSRGMCIHVGFYVMWYV